MSSTSAHSRYLSIGPGLSFSFEESPEPIRGAIEKLASEAASVPEAELPEDPISIGSDPVPAHLGGRPSAVEQHSPLTVTVVDRTLLLELPGLTTWCDLRRARGGIAILEDAEPDLQTWNRLALPRLIHELASLHGWFPLLSCVLASSGRSVAFPARAVGTDSTPVAVPEDSEWRWLASRWIWIQRRADGWTVHPYRPLGEVVAESRPDSAAATLSAIAYADSTTAYGPKALRLDTPEALVRLVRSVDLLALGGGAGTRFGTLTELATVVPSYRIPSGLDAETLVSHIGGLVD